jgi:F0F1-type ATP synthase delta subunit
MTNLLKQLVEVSYLDGVLDAVTVARIADKLSRTQLKAYIRALKDAEKQRTVRVEAPAEPTAADRKALESIFSGKMIVTEKNPDLLLGLRITNNDDVYNMNLKHSLERIAAYAAE